MDIIASVTASATTQVIARHTRVLWPRYLALVIDGLIISVLAALLNTVFGPASFTFNADVYSLQSQPTAPLGDFSTGMLAVVLLIGYFAVQEALLGATVGKALCRLHVVGLDERCITGWAALWRNLLRPIDYFFFIGAVLVAFSPWHQRLGDRVARTIVVGDEALTAPLYRRAERRRGWLVLTGLLTLVLGGTLAFNYFARPQLIAQNLRFTPLGTSARCVISYRLGTPTRTGDDITYPLIFQTTNMQHPTQTGSITLHWYSLFAGWQFQFAEGVNCSYHLTR